MDGKKYVSEIPKTPRTETGDLFETLRRGGRRPALVKRKG